MMIKEMRKIRPLAEPEEVCADLEADPSALNREQAKLALDHLTRHMTSGQVAAVLCDPEDVRGSRIAAYQARLKELDADAAQIGVVYASSPDESMHHPV